MPLVSRLGAASSRGFGEFNQQAQGKYIEDFFATTLYGGNDLALRGVTTNIGLENTTAWDAYIFSEYISYDGGMTTDASGNFYVSGTSQATIQPIVFKFNSSGVLQWGVNYSGAAYGTGVAVDSSGNVYSVGWSGSSPSAVGWLVKYNSSGAIQWQRTLAQGDSNLNNVAVDANGDVCVCGFANDGNYYILVAKYDSSGTLLWQKKLREGNGYIYANSIKTDASNNIYITGKALTSGSITYAFICKLDSSGAITWQRKITRSGSVEGTSIAVDSSLNVYVTGGTDLIWTAKYNSSGTLQWQRQIGSNGSAGRSISVDSSGNVYVAGDFSGTPTFAMFIKYDTSGSLQWQKFYGPLDRLSYGQEIAASADGNLFASGIYAGPVDTYSFILKLKQDGSTTSGFANQYLVQGNSTDAAGTGTAATSALTISNAGATSSTRSGSATATTGTSTTYTQKKVTGTGGLVWLKSRSSTVYGNALFDTVRGAGNYISSNGTGGSSTSTTLLNSFTASGFTVGNSFFNTSPQIYVAWTFKTEKKFAEIVSYTGNGSNRTIAHNLGSVPGMILIKRTDTTAAWAVYHRSLANTEYLVLNTTAAKATDATYWNSTTPTATNFSLGTSTNVNANGGTYVAYLFAHDAGGFGADGSQNVISCGSFTTDAGGAATINLGWEPQFILYKPTSLAGGWFMSDNMRGFTVNSATARLSPNTSGAEDAGSTSYTGILQNGFTINSSFAGTQFTGIYLAIRRGPMAVPTDATKVFMPTVYTGTNVDNRLVNTTIAPDTVWVRQRNDTVLGGMVVGDRLRGQPYLLTGTTAAEVTAADAFDAQIVSTTEYGTAFSSMNGFWCGNNATSKLNTNTTSNNHIVEAFKRAPGFHDVVCYSGTGTARTVSHTLGVAPELMIFKDRNGTSNWAVYSSALGATKALFLNTTSIPTTSAAFFNDTAPTASVFTVNFSGSTNDTGFNYVAYLFASCPGVSKVGSYTGTGTTQQINCGFTSGARFVLIKRTDSTGDWYVYDSARGIVAGNDPYLRLNSTAAEVTSTDYVDTYSAGFELSSTAPAGLNEAVGITWTSQTSGFGTSTIYGVTYGNGRYVAVGDSGKLYTSPDYVTWTSQTSQFGTSAIYDVNYVNGIFIAVGASGKISTSTDGVTWTARTSGFGADAINSVTYGNGLYVIVGDNDKLATSTDAVTWTLQTGIFGSGNPIYACTYGNGLYVIAGNNGILYTSSNASSWTSRTSQFGSNSINDVTYANSLFVAVGEVGKVSTSVDGTTWTARTSGQPGISLQSVAYGNGIYTIVGASGTLTTSPDAITWTGRTSGFGGTAIEGIAFGNSAFVAVGGSGTITTNNPSYLYLAIA